MNRSMGFSQLGQYMRYSQSKLSAILFSRQLNKKYPNGEIRSAAVHPGFVASNLYQGTPLQPVAPHIFIKVAEGALASLYCASSPEIEEENSWCVVAVARESLHSLTACPQGRLPRRVCAATA